MKILVISASFIEAKEVLERLQLELKQGQISHSDYEGHSLDFIITGVGSVSATFHIQKALYDSKYDLAISIGISGTYDETIKIGDVVEVIEEEFADLGIYRYDRFSTLFEAGLKEPDQPPFKNGNLINEYTYSYKKVNYFRKAKGVTVNHPSPDYGKALELHQKYNADIETMENAALFYVCLMIGQHFISLRSISNMVGDERTKWDIPMAVSSITEAFFNLLKEINQ